jgi:hypothetical protein
MSEIIVGVDEFGIDLKLRNILYACGSNYASLAYNLTIIP